LAKEKRKVRVGSVVRTRMDKTAVVEMVWKQRDRLYRKQVRRVARYMVHDPLSQCQLGDVVRIQETRPISKSKHWRLLEILERREVAEVRPIELEADAEDIDEEEVEEEVLDLLEEGAQDYESEEDE
jgi:small subunit ribosomal protein S17